MSKTNKELASEFAKTFVDRMAGHGIHIPFWAHQGLYNTAVELMTKAEKRIRKKEHRRYELLLSELGYPESTPKYTVCQAEAFADDLVSAAYGVANYNSVENNDDLKEMREAVIGAIAGSDKPAPQFDAEKVRMLIKKYAYHKWSAGVGSGSNSLCSRDYSDAQADIVLDELLSALHIE